VSALRESIELPQAVDVMGLPIRPLRTAGLIDLLVDCARRGVRTTACYANAHTVNLASSDPSFGELMRSADLLYADGASVVWASRWSERPLPERMTAADYFPRFAKRCAAEDLSLFLLGGRPGVAERAAEALRASVESTMPGTVPGLRIVGVCDGYFDEARSEEVIDRIRASGADVLVAGLSSPRQERWLADHSDAIDAPVRWCVGGLFDYLAGRERRAPAWLCRWGGEWVFRLCVNPAGKWRRYLVGNPLFVWRALRWGLAQGATTARRPGDDDAAGADCVGVGGAGT
jgi:N-acetylglucosaminyldiphosphoundecaprenol N-acetyl-beta-D-mannosaminyltransferase